MRNPTQRLILRIVVSIVWLWVIHAGLCYPVNAQATVELAQFSVEIWPEFDSPATLVIYRGELATSVELPAALSFELPGYLSDMNAVASLNAQSRLVNNPFTIESTGEVVQLHFTVNSPSFQFEYYDPVILEKDDTERTLTYDLKSPYRIYDFRLEVQQPAEASELQLSPEPDDVFVGGDQLTYYSVLRQDISSGQLISLQGSYQKDSSRLTTGRTFQASVTPFNPFSTIRNWLIGLTLITLTAAVGFWVFYRRSTLAVAVPVGRADKGPRQCPQCQTVCRVDAIFCHQCGSLIEQ